VNDPIEALRKRYSVHPLMFVRTVELTKGVSELFEALETMSSFPVQWESDRWVTFEMGVE